LILEDGYEPLLVQEIMSSFFGVGLVTDKFEPATKEEQETFLDLLEGRNGEFLALDFLNSWLIGRGQGRIPDKLLNSVKKFGKINNKNKKSKKKRKREVL